MTIDTNIADNISRLQSLTRAEVIEFDRGLQGHPIAADHPVLADQQTFLRRLVVTALQGVHDHEHE